MKIKEDIADSESDHESITLVNRIAITEIQQEKAQGQKKGFVLLILVVLSTVLLDNCEGNHSHETAAFIQTLVELFQKLFKKTLEVAEVAKDALDTMTSFSESKGLAKTTASVKLSSTVLGHIDKAVTSRSDQNRNNQQEKEEDISIFLDNQTETQKFLLFYNTITFIHVYSGITTTGYGPWPQNHDERQLRLLPITSRSSPEAGSRRTKLGIIQGENDVNVHMASPDPEPDEKATETQVKEYNNRLDEWMILNEHVRSLIMSTILETLQIEVITTELASEAWKIVTSKFDNQSEMVQANLLVQMYQT
ncbi:hypothetical protein Clacol_005730 [Clathrus columnatus]|uniref:Uncharacterized protein n=1 Tax=Clathrus columnatus TaxID=1419009 RepID=A0AAV5ACS7_9AGAM|nr:hypothetical protein Clacol_005730 [Clathrus columnatus]